MTSIKNCWITKFILLICSSISARKSGDDHLELELSFVHKISYNSTWSWSFVFVVDNIFLMDALLKPWLIKLMPNSILIQQFFTLLPKCALHFIPCKKHVFLVKVFMQVILMVKKYSKYSSSWTLSLSLTHIYMYVCMYVGMCVGHVCMYVCIQ